VGDAFEFVETISLEAALLDSSSFSVEKATAPAMTEVKTAPERIMLSDLFILLLSYVNSRQKVLLIAFFA